MRRNSHGNFPNSAMMRLLAGDAPADGRENRQAPFRFRFWLRFEKAFCEPGGSIYWEPQRSMARRRRERHGSVNTTKEGYGNKSATGSGPDHGAYRHTFARKKLPQVSQAMPGSRAIHARYIVWWKSKS